MLSVVLRFSTGRGLVATSPAAPQLDGLGSHSRVGTSAFGSRALKTDEKTGFGNVGSNRSRTGDR
jgi:hypothetical protein